MSLDLSIVIVSYETRDITLACLRSVYAETDAPSFEVIVVDNASTDGSPEAVRREFPEVELVALQQNVGFARANNLAAERARGEHLLLLNPDTIVLDRAIERLLAFARAHPEAGLCGGRTLYEDRSLNATSCFGLPTVWSMICSGLGLASLFRGSSLFNPELIGGWKRDTVREVGVITGCFLLARRDFWNELGGFDESFFMYGEDMDLSLRALRAGKSCLHCPEATIVHYGGAADRIPSEKRLKVFRAKAQFMTMHWSPAAARFGIRMLDLHAWSRTALHFLRSRWSGREDSYRTWAGVWQRRAEWRRGRAAASAPTNQGPSEMEQPWRERA